MKNKALKSAAVLGTVAVASFILAACGSKASSTKSSESGDKNVTVYVEEQYKAYMEKAAAAFEKKLAQKLLLKLVTKWVDWTTFHLTTNLVKLLTF